MPHDHSCAHRFRCARWLLIPLLAFSVVFAAGCGGDGESDDDPGDSSAMLELVPAESLTGKTFVSTDVKGQEMVPGTRITMSFGPGSLTASAGCNSIRGPLKFEKNGAFSLTKTASTLLGCPGGLRQQDGWLESVLSMGLRPYWEDGKLLLLSLGTEIVMEEGTVTGGPPGSPGPADSMRRSI